MLVERGLQVMNVEAVGEAYAIASNYLRRSGAIAAIITSNAAQAADRIPDELLGCWKYVESGLGIRNPDSIYTRVDFEDCKGQMLISSDGWVGDYDVGKIDCRLRSVISSDAKRGRYKFRFECPEGVLYSIMRLKGNALTIRVGVVP